MGGKGREKAGEESRASQSPQREARSVLGNERRRGFLNRGKGREQQPKLTRET